MHRTGEETHLDVSQRVGREEMGLGHPRELLSFFLLSFKHLAGGFINGGKGCFSCQRLG